MANTITFEITLSSAELVERIDKMRGDKSRDAWIEEAIKKQIPARRKIREELEVTLLRMADGTAEEAFNLKDSAVYLGVSEPGFEKIRARLKEEGKPIRTFKLEYRPDNYILRADLDELMTAKPV